MGMGGCRSIHRIVVWILILTAAMGSAVAAPTQAFADDWQPPRTVFVATAGHTADGLFLDLWRERHDLTGDPITEEFRPRSSFAQGSGAGSVVQFYENVAFLYDPDAEDGVVVRLLDLGRQQLANLLDESPVAALRAAAQPAACPPSARDCLDAPEAGHTVRGPVRAYWEDTGGVDWLGHPVTEAYRVPDGSYLQFFERGALRVDRGGKVAPLPLGRIVAGLQDLDIVPIAQPEGVPAYDESLFVAPVEPEPAPEPEREPESEQAPAPEPVIEPAEVTEWTAGPGPQVGAWKEIVVSIGQQSMWAYEDGALVKTSLVSTGTAEVPQTETPIGTWSILTKYDIQDMEGTISGEDYFVPDVPDVMYFDNLGNALHGTYWHNNFGTPMSHGCVNLPLDVAAWMYDWAPIGTAVTVIP